MKKIISFLLCVLILFTFSFSLIACEEDEGEVVKELTVFSWEDYIDLGDEDVPGRENSILDDFEEETGISVNYVTFANSEEMYNELQKNPEACDLLCPSEYMIMKMMNEGLLRPFRTPENYKKYCSEYIKDNFKKLGIRDENGEIVTPIMEEDEENTYAIGYMWGTMGYVYDMDRFDAEELSNWRVGLEDRFFDKVTVKDSVRDTYIMAVGAVYQDELNQLKEQYNNEELTLEDYNKELTKIFNRCDTETIQKVEEFLLELRENLYYFEVDNAKADILLGRIDLYFAWSGDAVYAMDCGDEIGISLGYVVPEEGSNVWFDGFVMPATVKKDAKVEAAIKFLDFISTPKSAARNMEYIGYSSVISGDEDFELSYIEYDEDGNPIEGTEYTVEYEGILDWVKEYVIGYSEIEDFNECEEVDLSYFFGEDTKVYSDEMGRQLYGLYSDTETIARCIIMDTFNDKASAEINEMWNRVKLIGLENWEIVLIIVAFVLAVLLVIAFKYKSAILDKIKFPSLIERRRAKYKLVKRENVN